MTVPEALAARRSVRAFLPKPVETEKLTAVFEAAARTPSWANTQPWDVFVATGETLERIRQGYKEKYAGGAKPEPETPRAATWSEEANRRRAQLQPDMKRDCGDAVQQFGELNQSLFHAPAVIYLCTDKVHSEWSLYDIGAYAQSLMLTAAHCGLGTMPAITLTFFPDILHRELEIPSDLKVTIGIAIGYPDTQNDINKFVSARDPVDKVVRIFT